MAMNKVLLATTNQAKAAKLRWLLEGIGLQCVAPDEPLVVSEEGKTHRENAEAKALAWSKQHKMPAIASDGGLVIPALGDRWEPLLTARFAGPAASDRDRLERLLELMRPYKGQERAAYWREAISIAARGRIEASWDAESHAGLLDDTYNVAELRPGFWAFTVWRIPALGKTYNQLSPEEIERLEDHWGRLRHQVRAWFAGLGDLTAEAQRPRRNAEEKSP